MNWLNVWTTSSWSDSDVLTGRQEISSLNPTPPQLCKPTRNVGQEHAIGHARTKDPATTKAGRLSQGGHLGTERGPDKRMRQEKCEQLGQGAVRLG